MSELFVKFLNMSLTASVLLAVILLVRALLIRFVTRRGIGLLWLVAAIALVCPWRPTSPISIWSTTEPIVGFSALDEYAEESTAQIMTQTEVMPPQYTEETYSVLSAPEGTGDPLDIPSDYIQEITVQQINPSDTSALPYAEYPIKEQAGGTQTQITGSRIEWLTILFRIWFVGCAGMLVYALIRYLQLKNHVAVSVPFVDGAYLCDGIDTPFLLGFFPPKIYLPSSMAEGDFVPVIAHERAHIARGDHLWKALGFGILALHWFNPLVWISYHLFCRDLEFSCDARAVRNLCEDERRSYAEALLSCSVGCRRAYPLSYPLAFGEVGVKERISAVLSYCAPRRYQTVIVVLLCAVLSGCFLTEQASMHRFVEVLEQNGYTVHKAELYQTLEIKVPAALVSDYAKTGATVLYDPGDVVVYDCAPTVLSLTKITPTNDSEDQYWMDFTFTYSTPPTEGVITTLLRPEYEDGNVTTWSSIPSLVGDAWDASTTYPDSAECLYQAEGVTFGIRIDREVLANADTYIAFTVGGLSDVYYSRGEKNPTDAITVTEGGPVGPDCVEMYVNSFDETPIDLALAHEAFPDVTLYADANGIYTEQDGERVQVISGMPVRNVYLSDLTGDGKPEFCASVYWGSGMVDEHIVVYDLANHREYTLWERGVFDFRLEMENHTLYAVMTKYNSDEELYRDVLMLIPTGDDYALSMGEPHPDSILFDLYENAEYYVSERCIYMSPLSSSISIGGDTGYRYLIDPEQNSFCQINRDTGSIRVVGSLLGGWKDFPWTDEEWAELFTFGEIKDTPISEIYSERKVLSISADQYLLSMDGELWLMKVSRHPDGPEFVWSIHELVPEKTKGFTYYRYVPAMSALPPYLNITFDLPYDMNISAYCGETALASAPTKGREQQTWNQSWNNTDGELQVCWSPTEGVDGYIPGGVERASITFTALNEEQTRYCAGTIYITRDEEASSSGDYWYHVTVVGHGLTVTNDESGFGAVVHWNDGVTIE